MSQHYYADGSKHIDNHKEINIGGNISSEGLERLVKGFLADDDVEDASFEEIKSETVDGTTLRIPEQLNTPEAQKLWKIVQERGWVNERLQPKINQNKAAILAFVMKGKLKTKPQWRLFEELWGILNLANKLSHAQLTNYYADTLKMFEKAFSE